MRTLFSLLTGLALFIPSVSFAAVIPGGSVLGNALRDLYATTGQEARTIMTDDSLPLERKFQTLSNVLKTKHDTAMNAIRNLK